MFTRVTDTTTPQPVTKDVYAIHNDYLHRQEGW